MLFFELDPDTPGMFGENAKVIHRPGTHPLVTRLHFEFRFDTASNDLMACQTVFMVTKALADGLRQAALTGFTLSTDIEVSGHEDMFELWPDWQVPILEWLQVSGAAGSDDFGLDPDAFLVVSDAALAVLRRYRIDHCEITPYAA